MARALLTSKYRTPLPREGAIARLGLGHRLVIANRAPLTLLSAPAGFGKTTLLTEWFCAPDTSATTAWLALDRGDNDPVLFWTYLATAVRAAVPGTGELALQLLAASSPSVPAAIAALLNDIEALPSTLVLVLDDYHLIESPEIHSAIGYVLDHLPRRLRLVLATRHDPPLPLATLRARGQLVEVRAADLRFSTDEAAAYLNGSMRLGLSDADVRTLEGRTEGWIAALQLAALSLRDRSDASGFIAGFAGDDRYIVDYLAEEVLGRQDPDVRDFLLHTSVLERLTGPLCDAVTGHGGGKSMLAALERANLFLVPLDDRRQSYRYHQLFADVLQAHLLDECPALVPVLHRRASEWFEAQEDTSQAIGHALAGEDTARAAGLMELAMPLMFRQRRETELAHWLRALPDEVVRARPVLGIAFVGALAQASDFGSVGERLDGIEAGLRDTDGRWPDTPPDGLIVIDQDNYLSLPAHLQMYRAALALTNGDLAGTIAHAATALELVPAHDALTRAAAGALGGLASWTTGDLAGAQAAYTESVSGLRSIGFLADVLGCTITLGDLCRTQGRLDAALDTYRHALASTAAAPGTPPTRGTADMHVGTAGVLLERNDLDGARQQLDLGRRLGEHNGLPQNAYRWRIVLARLRAADGDLTAALALLDEADRVYAGDYAPNVQPVPAVRARLWLRRDELAPAQQWARDQQLSASDEPGYLREYEHLTLARLLIARHRTEPAMGSARDALALLDRLLAAAEQGGRGASVIEALLLQALANQADRNVPAALSALSRAVTRAAPERFVRLFLDEGAPLVALLNLLAKQPDAPHYVRDLLAETAKSGSMPQSPQRLVDALSERELDVLRLLGSDLGGPDIARELSVSLNTLRTHTKNIYAKLGVSNRREAVSRGRDLDLTRSHRPG